MQALKRRQQNARNSSPMLIKLSSGRGHFPVVIRKPVRMDRLAWGRQDHFRGRPSQRRKLGYAGFVAKQTITTIFIVEPANDGWSVGVGDGRLSRICDQAPGARRCQKAASEANRHGATQHRSCARVGLNQRPKYTLRPPGANAIEAAISNDIATRLDTKKWKRRDIEIERARKLL